MNHTKNFSIGNIDFENRIVLAPMAGITDLPFRLIARRFHNGLVFSEMISSQSLIHCNRRTKSLISISDTDKPISVQLLGKDPSIMAEAARIAEAAGADIVDINIGCSVRKVLKQGEGSALLREPERIREIVEKVIKAVKIPVTAKLRKGFKGSEKCSLEISRMLETTGISAITIHGRSIEQMFTGKADWNIIEEIKETVRIPVIGNGDINSPEDAYKRLQESKCDAVMIGRAVLGDPWLLGGIVSYLEGTMTNKPDISGLFQIIQLHIEFSRNIFGDIKTYKTIRKHIAWYLKGQPLSARAREALFKSKKIQDVISLLEDYRNFLEEYNNISFTPGKESIPIENLFKRYIR